MTAILPQKSGLVAETVRLIEEDTYTGGDIIEGVHFVIRRHLNEKDKKQAWRLKKDLKVH